MISLWGPVIKADRERLIMLNPILTAPSVAKMKKRGNLLFCLKLRIPYDLKISICEITLPLPAFATL